MEWNTLLFNYEYKRNASLHLIIALTFETKHETKNHGRPPGILDLRRQLLFQEVLESLAILSELLDTLVELVERHRVLEQCPAELGLVVDVRNLGELVRGRGGYARCQCAGTRGAQGCITHRQQRQASWGRVRSRS